MRYKMCMQWQYLGIINTLPSDITSDEVMRAPNEVRRLTYIGTGNEYGVSVHSLYLLAKTVESINADSRVSAGLEKNYLLNKKKRGNNVHVSVFNSSVPFNAQLSNPHIQKGSVRKFGLRVFNSGGRRAFCSG